MKTITLQDRHALLLHALLKKMPFKDALRIIESPSPSRFHRPDGTDECIRLFPATRSEVDTAICAVCDQLKYQLNA